MNYEQPEHALTRRAFLGCSAALGTTFLLPSLAWGDEEEDEESDEITSSQEAQAQADAIREKLVNLQAELEVAADAYYKALEEQQAAQALVDAEQAKIDSATNRVNSLQDRLGSRIRSMYRSGSTTFLDFMLGAASFEEFAQNWDLLSTINESDGTLIDETKALRGELQASRDELARQTEIAAAKTEEARVIRDDAQSRLSEASLLIVDLDEQAQTLLQQEMAIAAAAAAAAAAARASIGGGIGGEVGDYTAVAELAASCIGTPYVWGGATPGSGMDCSGLVVWCYAQLGVSLPHYTESLYACAKRIVPIEDARPGDVLYRPGHVGIAAAAGGVPYVHAPTFNAYVRNTDSLSWAQFVCALQF